MDFPQFLSFCWNTFGDFIWAPSFLMGNISNVLFWLKPNTNVIIIDLNPWNDVKTTNLQGWEAGRLRATMRWYRTKSSCSCDHGIHWRGLLAWGISYTLCELSDHLGFHARRREGVKAWKPREGEGSERGLQQTQKLTWDHSRFIRIPFITLRSRQCRLKLITWR